MVAVPAFEDEVRITINLRSLNENENFLHDGYMEYFQFDNSN
jgi:hypothetical protein